ncbi:hypothetical protein RND81_07G182500 [Saponaria officinalis]|uniref:ZF-HD dimerization-type domain-containing protein n=1 Tax=Saponaria officinalis TaxID=3572 RepID=A0AAW1JT62_SAPOF
MAIDMDMDLGGVSVPRTRTPDSDTDTPPRNPPTKRVHHTTLTHAPGVSYKECMKNHAASIGGHALDGCCEFIPSPTFNPVDPTSLKCGACGCHRNFHRRDPDDPTPLNHHPTPARRPHSPPSASQLLLSLSQSPSGPSDEVNPTGVTLSGACGGGSGGSGGGVLVGYTGVGGVGGGHNGNFTSSASGSSRKRFRTKFTQEQKEKMFEFSEKIGWKLKKGDEKLIEDFVREIGVERSVFKVWMHNNKHTSSSVPKPRIDLEHNSKTNTTNTTSSSVVKVQDHVVSATSNYVQQHSTSSSNGGKSNNNNNNNVGNCGASVFDNHNHNHNHNHPRQFNFGNGGGQEATQAQ